MNPVNGIIFIITGQRVNGKPRVGAVARYYCVLDSRFGGDNNLTCQRDGTWILGRPCSGNKMTLFLKSHFILYCRLSLLIYKNMFSYKAYVATIL